MKKPTVHADLKLNIGFANIVQINELIEETIADGFNLIALDRTIGVTDTFRPSNIDKKPYLARKVKILERCTVLVKNKAELNLLKKCKERVREADLVALEFQDADTLEHFLKKFPEWMDNFIYINIATFNLSSYIFKLLKPKEFFIEFDYSKLFDSTKKKQAMVNFFRMADSHLKRLILSSDARDLFDRRAQWEVSEVVNDLFERSEAYSTKMVKEMTITNPLELVKRSVVKRQGFAYFSN